MWTKELVERQTKIMLASHIFVTYFNHEMDMS